MKEYILITENGKTIIVIDKSKALKEDVSPMIGRFVFDGYTVETVASEYRISIENLRTLSEIEKENMEELDDAKGKCR